jgi:2-oxoglutarate dehydrogenase E2 component (dihydrolipoamide succinyltransferase)
MVPARALRPRSHPLVMLPSMMQTVRTYADSVIKVPQMAESISEGTLKQFSKSVGDYVEQDEEIATIETDKVCRHNRIKTVKFSYFLLTPG